MTSTYGGYANKSKLLNVGAAAGRGLRACAACTGVRQHDVP